jgi:NhaP-type Na+/H+ or K+/H+ antiporter
MTLACVYLLHMSWGPALLIAAMLAPTDPVLAHDVQVQVPGDVDLLRFSLTGEGGLNDGIALPFALLGIAVCNYEASPQQALSWHFAADAMWGVAGALAVGWLLGDLAVRLIAYLRTRHSLALGPEGFYALGLIALSYGIAELMHTYAFLAVFAAGLAMRRVEQKASGDKSVHEAVGKIDAQDVGATASDPDRAHAFVAERVLGFTIELERIAEVAVMLMVGSVLANVWDHLFTWRGAAIVALLFFVARPISVQASLIGSSATRSQRLLTSWFGIRGVGSFYYLLYALEHAPRSAAQPLVPLVLAVIAASVIMHGITSTPLMNRYKG